LSPSSLQIITCAAITVSSISIVAVHGLNFKNTSDHARSTWTDNGQLWLRDFLPARLPKPARVMLFEYNASPAMGAAAINMDDYTKNLLQWLGIRRKVCSQLGQGDYEIYNLKHSITKYNRIWLIKLSEGSGTATYIYLSQPWWVSSQRSRCTA
jgi:hypothetical protein